MKIGLIAGAGELPEVFRKNAIKNKEEVFTLGAKDITTIEADVYLPVGKISKLIELLKEKKVDKIVMLGKFEHKLSLDPRNYDIKAVSILTSLKDKNPSSIVRAFMDFMQEEGFSFLDPKPYLSELLIEKEGLLNDVELDENVVEDIEFGAKIAKNISDMDIGQTVVVKQKAVVAVEAMEGTDKTILRAFDIAGKGTVVIKSARTNQDFRIDVPTVGIDTLNTLKEVKAKAIAIQKGKVYVLEKEKFIKMANHFGIGVYAYE